MRTEIIFVIGAGIRAKQISFKPSEVFLPFQRVPLLQVVVVHASVILYMTFVLTLFLPHLYFLWLRRFLGIFTYFVICQIHFTYKVYFSKTYQYI